MSSSPSRPLKWSHQFDILPPATTPALKGDKIILPPSALEQLLSAATVTVASATGPRTSTFDPFNPHSFAAEAAARQQFVEQQQHLPHPLTFRLVNPSNGRIVFAGVREFSAPEGCVGVSSFLKNSLGIDEEHDLQGQGSSDHGEETSSSRMTIHVQEIPKGTFVRLRPLEAGYDPDDWKALLENYLRDTFTTLTNKEIINIPAGRESFRFLVDGLKPNEDAVSLVDTDIEVDIEPLNEEQARETLHKLAQKAQRAPGTKDGSSVGGKLSTESIETGQVFPGDYVDYDLNQWDRSMDLEVEVTSMREDSDIDVFVSPFSQKHRTRPREQSYVFGDVSSRAAKRIKISHSNVELDSASAIWLSIRGYNPFPEDEASRSTPIIYSLRISSVGRDRSATTRELESMTDSANQLDPDEERCSNCHQAVPKRTMFLHQNFCLRNNVLCPRCDNVFQKTSPEWKEHWHCDHDEAYGNAPYSRVKHDKHMHTPTPCPSCDFDAPNIPVLAHHQTTTCPAKLILCQFCHLQVPQQGPDDPALDSAEVLLSGLTPHEVSDGARTTECHLCDRIVRLRDMSAHLRHHDLERLNRTRPRICRNINCGHVIDNVSKTGNVKTSAPAKNELGVCDTCFGPLYVSMYDPEGKALRRRVERKYLTQLLTGCGHSWCRNEYCKTGRQHLHTEPSQQPQQQQPSTPLPSMTSKEAMQLIRPILDHLTDGITPLNFCTDETSQRRRTLAEMIAAEGQSGVLVEKGKGKGAAGESGVGGGYELEWCCAALDIGAGDLDKARGWLKGFAPTRAETIAHER